MSEIIGTERRWRVGSLGHYMTSLWLLVFISVLVWSAQNPRDDFTWFLEVLPVLVGFAVLAKTRWTFPLTPLAYLLILLHFIILMVGGHYTYAQVPLFEWIGDALNLARNDYDKLGHLAQGFVPAIIAREVLLRKGTVKGAFWLGFISVSVCLGISALHGLVEWWAAVWSGNLAQAFLGIRGYVWDTRSDMAMALMGAVLALLILSDLHDRQLRRLRL